MSVSTTVQVYLRNFASRTDSLRVLLYKVEPDLLQFYLQGPATLHVREDEAKHSSMSHEVSLALVYCSAAPSAEDLKVFKIVPSIVVFEDGRTEIARRALDAGAVDCLCLSELHDAKILVPCLLYAARRIVLERQLAVLSTNARHVTQIEQEAFARLALLPASNVRELFGLLSGIIDDKLSNQGQRALQLISGALSRLLPPEGRERRSPLITRDVEALSSLLLDVIRGRGIEAETLLELDETVLSDSRRAECQEFLLHAAILVILSASPGMRVQMKLRAQPSGIRLEMLAPAEILAAHGLDRRPLLNELFGSLLRVTVDHTQVRFVLSSETKSLESVVLNVLIIDDNHVNALLLERLVSKQGHKPFKFLNSLEALESCKNERYDVVITDVHMPELDGITFTERLRGELKLSTPVFAITADDAPPTRKRCFEVGMEDVIVKPYSAGSIKAILNSVSQRLGATSADVQNKSV